MNRPEIRAGRGGVSFMHAIDHRHRTAGDRAGDVRSWLERQASPATSVSASVTAVAPGKVVVMGEHAAMYGRPAIVAALGLHCRASVRAEAEDGVRVELPDAGVCVMQAWAELEDGDDSAQLRAHGQASSPWAPMPGGDPLRLARIALAACLHQVRRPRGMSLRIESPLPPDAGFGDATAMAVAVVAALLAWDDDAIDVARIGAIARGIAPPGCLSGVGHGAVLHGGLMRAAHRADGTAALTPLPFRRERLRRLQLYHSGVPAEAADEVAGAVRGRLAQAADRDALLASMERATLAFGAWLAGKGDLSLGGVAAVRDYERCLEQLGVVPAPVRAAIRAIEAAGGAAKISGAGALTGTGAGALLVLWPGRPALSLGELAGWERCTAPLGMPGLRVARETEAAP